MADKLVRVLEFGLFGHKEPGEPRPIAVLRAGQDLKWPPIAPNADEAERLARFALQFLH